MTPAGRQFSKAWPLAGVAMLPLMVLVMVGLAATNSSILWSIAALLTAAGCVIIIGIVRVALRPSATLAPTVGLACLSAGAALWFLYGVTWLEPAGTILLAAIPALIFATFRAVQARRRR